MCHSLLAGGRVCSMYSPPLHLFAMHVCNIKNNMKLFGAVPTFSPHKTSCSQPEAGPFRSPHTTQDHVSSALSQLLERKL
jgi:hypothetical protein